MEVKMSQNTYKYEVSKLSDTESHAPEEVHAVLRDKVLPAILGSEFILDVSVGMGGGFSKLNINSIQTKFFIAPGLVNVLTKFFKSVSITGESYCIETQEDLHKLKVQSKSSYKNLLLTLELAAQDLNNFENEIRDTIMSIDNFIIGSSKIIENILPYKKYSQLTRFLLSDSELRVVYKSDHHDFPFEKTFEKKLDNVRINFSFIRDKDNRMVISDPYGSLIHDVFRKRYLRDSEWPYLLFSDLEVTCNEIKEAFSKHGKMHKKYKKYFNSDLNFWD
jgi:hypothetical protein